MLRRTCTVLTIAVLVTVGAVAVATPVAADDPPNICQGYCPGPVGDVARAVQDFCWQAVGHPNCIPR